MDKDSFRTIATVLHNQPWFVEHGYVDRLSALLYDEGHSEEQRKLLVDLLSRFNFFDDEKVASALNEITEEIVTDPSLSDSTTQIVAMAHDSSADSSQAILHGLKGRLAAWGWSEHLLVNRCDHSCKNFNKHGKKHVNIVLVDEFIGSGQTVLNRIRSLQSQYGDEDINILVKSVICTAVGRDNLTRNNVKFEYKQELPRGISDYYTDSLSKAVRSMEEMEARLAPVVMGRDLPNFGYGGAEALYYKTDSNTPNSVFPIFWWPQLKSAERRKNLFSRALADA